MIYGDHKPRIVEKPEPVYPEKAKADQVWGTVALKVVLVADGQVTNIKVVKGFRDGLTESAIAAAKRVKFIPAVKYGKPVSVSFQLEYFFNLY